MKKRNRREFLSSMAKLAGVTSVTSTFPPCIQRALAVPANRRTGTIQDVEHIVILTQENRSFDHYFGTLSGVRGFADPFPIPRPDTEWIRGKSIWHQPSATPFQPTVAPFHLNTTQHFEYTRVEGTPHSWGDAQRAWNHGTMSSWPLAKRNHSMGYFGKDDIPFQWALANAFTICDAYHSAAQTGTNPNRLYLWTGTNDPLARGNGPATYNDYDWFDNDPGNNGGYTWTTYPERLEQAGVSWQVYQDMADNFTDNPLAGFRSFRDAWFQTPGYSQNLRDRGVSTRDLDALADDVMAGRLPQVSWIVATAEGSEHPGPSSPAQGAAYTERVLDALTANPEVWSKTVLLINFDENDGFFDHVPPPAPPSYASWDPDRSRSVFAGASTVDTTGEYHEHLVSYHSGTSEQELLHRPYGLGPRVPFYAVSPWSKGGWVNSQVFDHTSVLRFIEARFGVREDNISMWRRAVCGDLTSAFDFSLLNDTPAMLPDTLERAERARALPGHTTPVTPTDIELPAQEPGVRPSRALPYELHVSSRVNQTTAAVELDFANSGTAGAVFHAYDRLSLDAVPRRYTVEPGKHLSGVWQTEAGLYDLWVIGPNGFHRHFCGNTNNLSMDQPDPEIFVEYDLRQVALTITLSNTGGRLCDFVLRSMNGLHAVTARHTVAEYGSTTLKVELRDSLWYDFLIVMDGDNVFGRRFAGRMETGQDSVSDPAMHGVAVVDQFRFDLVTLS